jgi:hypothetical protein
MYIPIEISPDIANDKFQTLRSSYKKVMIFEKFKKMKNVCRGLHTVYMG